ncbi:hypothetical protein BGZ93_003020 [Podila epicladia]|nr:hypothetical protein BGZ93_003020 [Podila epicladia]
MERPVIMPISTETRSSHTSPKSDAYSVKGRLGAGLPSPPLSPQQDYGFAKRSSAALSSLPFITVSGADSDNNHDSDTASLTSTQDLPLLPSNSPPSFTPAHEPADTPTTPMLPSQLRRRHESLKLQTKQEQQPSPSPPPPPPQPFLFSTSKHYEDDYNSDDDNDPSSSHRQRNTSNLSLAPPTSSSLSLQPTHSLVRAKSYSQFETNRKAFGYPPISSYPSTSPSLSSYHTPSAGALHETRDWVKMQSRINELEMQISHVSRANQLLNQELDKVNGHLLRLTSDENGECDEGWRREYEFLVQQVDLMHRQLQMAQNPQYQYQLLMQHQQQLQQHQQQQLPALESTDRAEVSRQLHSEVKELTESLRSWQAAFQQAEEKYRRKCDGERALKQTLRERETQLSGLVSKLSSYESDFQQSIADYTTQIDTLIAKNNNSSSRKAIDENKDKSKKESEDMHMPGTFPSMTEHTDSNDQFSVSILSWAALLATYMLS